MANLGPQYQNLTYGSLLQVPGGVTDQLQVVTDGNGNNTGLLISSTGISIPGLVTTNAQNLNGGSIGSLPYQSGVSTTSFVSAGTPGQVLLSSGSSAPFWSNSVPTALLKAGDTMTGTLSMGANNITNLATPVLATDAATKNYVDSVAVGINVKTSCAAATTANITLSGAQTIDGVSVVAGNRVLVKNQTATADNGIYVASASAWTRATDADTWAELIGAMVFISAGTTNGLTSWISNTTSGGTIGVTAVTFVQFGASQSYTAGTGITLSGNQFSLTTPVTVSSGGTGVSSLTGVPWGNGGSAMTVATGAQLSGQMAGVGVANQLLQSNGASAPTWTSTPRGTSFQFNGSISNSVTINAGTNPASQTYSLPAAYPSSSGQVLSSTTGGAMSWAPVATTSGQSILAGNNSGGFQNVTLSGLSYNTSTSTLSVTGGSSSIANITDYGASPSASGATNTTAIQNAINTGKPVYIPTGSYPISSQITLSNPGQLIYGDGPNKSILVAQPGFSGTGVFLSTIYSDFGPVLKAFKITCVQPITSNRASLNTYPPALYFRANKRFYINELSITLFQYGIDMSSSVNGGTGGSFIDKLEISCFTTGIIMGGALDSERLFQVHYWPFDMVNTALETIWYEAANIGFSIGRVDDLIIDECLFINGGWQIYITDAVFGTITNCAFDAYGSLYLSAAQCNLSVSNCYFTYGNAHPASYLCFVYLYAPYETLYSTVLFTNCIFGQATSTTVLGQYGNIAVRGRIKASFTGCKFSRSGQANANNFIYLSGYGGPNQFNTTAYLTLNSCYFFSDSGVAFTNPWVYTESAAGSNYTTVVCTGNIFTPTAYSAGGGSAGIAVSLGSDFGSVIANNSLNGYSLALPTVRPRSVIGPNAS